MAMKAYAVARSLADFQKNVKRSKWDAHRMTNANWLAAFSTYSIEDIHRCQEAGVEFLPALEDDEGTPSPAFIAMIPAEAGLSAKDTPLAAAKKLHKLTGWPPHRPVPSW